MYPNAPFVRRQGEVKYVPLIAASLHNHNMLIPP